MTAVVVRRLNAGMYCKLNPKMYRHCTTRDELIAWAQQQVQQSNNPHCIVWANDAEEPVATYINLSFEVINSSELPKGGFWFSGQ